MIQPDDRHRITKSPKRLLLLAVLLLFMIANSGEAQRLQFLRRICIDDIIPEIPPIRVPIGCEVIDCCPGCPGPPVIDWKINVASTLPISFNLSFTNLPKEQFQKLDMEGKAMFDEAGVFKIPSGTTFIKGFKLQKGVKPPVAQFYLQMEQSKMETLKKEALKNQDEETPIRVVIEQRINNYIVSRTAFEYWIIWRCFDPYPILTDKIRLNNNTSNDNAVVVVDARRQSGCVNDRVFRGTNTMSVGNFLSNGSCRSEVGVFSDDNAFEFLENVTRWTDSPTDILRVDLKPIIQAPVSVWLMRAAPTVAGDFQNANLLFNTNHVGISFNTTVTNLVGNQNAANVIPANFGCSGPEINALRASAFYTPNRLNVYYVNRAFTGFNCIADPNIVFIGTTANNQTLAHEFGHAFSLGHTNGLTGFSALNLMIGGGANRDNITEGQGFRMNLNPTSMINTNGVRVGLTRTCADGTTSAACPALSFDVTPNN